MSVVQPKVDAMMPENVQEKELAEFMSKEESKACRECDSVLTKQMINWASGIVNMTGSTLPYHVKVIFGDVGPQVCLQFGFTSFVLFWFTCP